MPARNFPCTTPTRWTVLPACVARSTSSPKPMRCSCSPATRRSFAASNTHGATGLAGHACSSAPTRTQPHSPSTDKERNHPMNTTQEFPTSTDVLIVGAGPTGMTLATSLKQLGVNCIVIDQFPDATDDTRAGFVQPRTLEYLRRVHVAGPMIDDGLKGSGAVFADVDRDLIRLSYDIVDSPYPFLLMIPQWQTQRHLDRRFAELGGSVRRGGRLLDLVPEFPGSAATVVDSDGALRVINARFVAGCDGVHSRVRDLLGIGFPGSSPEQMFAVADVKLPEWPSDRVEPGFTLSPHGMLITSPLPGDDMAPVGGSGWPGKPPPPPA